MDKIIALMDTTQLQLSVYIIGTSSRFWHCVWSKNQLWNRQKAHKQNLWGRLLGLNSTMAPGWEGFTLHNTNNSL